MCESQYKFLGVILHERLCWKAHFEYLLRRARFAAFQVQRLIPCVLEGQNHAASTRNVAGPHFPAVRAMVLGVVYARASYSIQFMSGIGLTTMLDRLEAICVRPLWTTLALPGTTHIRSILAESGIPSLPLFRQQLLLSFARRCLSRSNDHPSRQLLERSLRTLWNINSTFTGRNGQDTKLRSNVHDDSRPLLYDVLEAEYRWGVRILPPKSPLQQPPQAHPAATLSCTELESMHAHSAGSPRIAALPLSDSSPAGPIPAPAANAAPSAHPSVLDSTAPDCPSSVSLLARKLSVAEWQHEASGGALMRTLKTTHGRSLYLYFEPRSTAVRRSRLRFNRAALAESLAKRGLVDSPLCPHSPCRRRKIAQTVEHALMQCPSIAVARQRCKNQLRVAGVPSLDLATCGVVQIDRRKSTVPAATPISAAASPSAVPPAARPVYFPGGAVARPITATVSPVPSLRKKSEFAHARKSLFITAALLLALQQANGNSL